MIKIEDLKYYNKDDVVLVVVESPNKVATISKFLPKNFIVKPTVGYFNDIKNEGLYNLGIDVKGNFEAIYEIDPKKKDVVKALKEAYSRATKVVIMSDPDRCGEDIGYIVVKELKIPKKKYARCTVHEITEKAILEALNNPRDIDMDLVHAAEARRKLDKIVGYRLSTIARNKTSAKSVGRCQSPALKLITEREEEINNFVPERFYEIWLSFIKNKIVYKAQYKGLIKDKKNTNKIDNKDDAISLLNNCKGKDYIVHDIISSDREVSPKPPFITSTLQQEASSRLGYSVKRTSQLAQQLFEGINIKGEHQALISYIRTDDTTLAPEFVETLQEFIKTNYGKDQWIGPRTKKKKSTDQGGHEAIRPIDLSITPEKLSTLINDTAMINLYRLIYNRTIACAMTNCVITDTDYIINNSGYKFVYTEHAIKVPGFRKVYALDDEEISQSVGLSKGEKIIPYEENK